MTDDMCKSKSRDECVSMLTEKYGFSDLQGLISEAMKADGRKVYI